MEFGVDEEQAAATAREVLVDRFAEWLESHPVAGADPWDAELALSWKYAYADGHYGRWTRDDVDELLLEHLPRKLSASPQQAATIPGSIAAFVTFLDDEGLLDPGGEPADAVARRAAAQQRAFEDAMADPANFGMAKRLLSHGGFDVGGDPPDQAALDEARERFNALPFEERGRILGLDDEPDDEPLPPLPIRPTPSPAELEALAADVVLLQRLDRLHAELAPGGTKLTKAERLPLAEARRLVAALGLDDRTEGIRSSAELPELWSLVQVGLYAGTVTIDGGRLRPVDDWPARSTPERWQMAVEAVLTAGAARLRFGASEPSPLHLAEHADAAAFHFLALLWLADEPVPFDLFVDLLGSVALADPMLARFASLGGEAWQRICQQRVEDVLRSLADAGVVTVDRSSAALAPAGPHLLAPTLALVGFDVLLPEELEGIDAGEAVDLLVERDVPPETVAAHWAAARPPRQAADELLAALTARPEPARVVLGFAVLEHLGDDAVEAVRAVLDGPLAPHAWLFLSAVGAVDPDDVPVELAVQAGIDLFLATDEIGGPADVIESLLGGIPPGEHLAFVDSMASAGHPGTGSFLDLLGRHHPDKAVAKHARKQAHRWRSAHPGR